MIYAPTKWGVPDWSNVSAYPTPVVENPMMVWAWEFLRRNHDYRAFFDETVRPWRMETGEYSEEADCAIAKALKRFGLLGFLPEPASSWAPFFESKSLRVLRSAVETERAVKIGPADIGYIFDMTLPLERQFALALRDARTLRDHRSREGQVETLSPRGRPEKYVTYLRIIDAKDCKISRIRNCRDLISGLRRSHEGRKRSARAPRQAELGGREETPRRRLQAISSVGLDASAAQLTAPRYLGL